MKQKMTPFMIVILILAQTGCGTLKKTTHAYDLRSPSTGSIVFNKEEVYVIKTGTAVYKDIKGSQLSWHGDWLIIDSPDGRYLTSFPYSDIQEITGISSKEVRSHWLAGLGIGAGAGALAGVGIVFAVANSGCHSVEECLGLGIGAASSLVVGSLVGLLVGTFIPKKEKSEEEVKP